MKTTATKAYVAAAVTAGGTLLAEFLTGSLQADTIESFGAALALAILTGAGVWAAPNKPK